VILPLVMARGGSRMVATDLLAGRRYDGNAEMTRGARAVVEAVPNGG
jgi:hypothetical protein